MRDSAFLKVLKSIAVANIVVVFIIMLDFLLVPVQVKRQLREFNSESIKMKTLRGGGSTSTEYYIELTSDERIYLPQRSELEFLIAENDTLLVHKTRFFNRNKYVEVKLEQREIKEGVSMLHSWLSLFLVLSALAVSILFMYKPGKDKIATFLIIETLINAIMMFMYFYRY